MQLESKSQMRFTAEEYAARVGRLAAELDRRGVGLYICTVPEHLNYFAGFDPSALIYYQQMYFRPDTGQMVVLTHRAESELARTGCWIDDIRVWRHGDDPESLTFEILAELGAADGMRVGVELRDGHLAVSTYARLQEAFPNIEFVDVTDVGEELRIVKSDAEVAYLREAARIADIGTTAALTAIRPGVSECEVNAEIQRALWRAGTEYPAFPTLVASGPRSGLFHGFPTKRVIESGEPVELEIAGVVARYNANMLRTPVAGKASARFRELYEIVVDAFWQGINAVKPGVPAGEIDRVTRRIREGYEDYFPARSGFELGLGYQSWVGKVDLLEGDPHTLEPGMVFSLEPSISQYEGMTVIVGNCFLVTDSGAEVLNTSSMSLLELE